MFFDREWQNSEVIEITLALRKMKLFFDREWLNIFFFDRKWQNFAVIEVCTFLNNFKCGKYMSEGVILVALEIRVKHVV